MLPWKLFFNLQAQNLRDIEPIPHIIRVIDKAAGIDVHQDFISTILSELFNNSLEHGLLDLDSNMKNDTDGFIQYYQIRRDRLAKLDSGYIDIIIEFIPAGDDSHVAIEVTDSGKGYCQPDIDPDQINENHGRGLLLIHKLTHQLTVSNDGRTTKVIYRLKQKN
ncbi:MAG: anti-sigma regulatory factor (Ser/Thr protein kinase) [Pseudohongiellaceae bacterium]|jgi:anti-sigma regulatory factor (Ser/Thr protein kinase)